MKKLSFTAVILIFGFISAFSQACPDSLYLTSQAQIDSFQINYPNCSEIEGDVLIVGDDITNLLGLIALTSIGGDLSIGDYWNYVGNPNLTNLTGLENITSIGGSLWIWNNSPLIDLTGLDNLTSIGGSLFIEATLISLAGLNNVSYIGEHIIISFSNLTNLTGLENVTTIGGSLSICCCRISSLAGLENLTTIGGGLILNASKDLASLTGLENVTSIGGSLEIKENHHLTSLEGLEGLTSIGEGLQLYLNWNLTSLIGLEGLTSIGGSLNIGEPWYGGNSALTSLTGLDNITSIGGGLKILHNNSLSTCEVESICAYLADPNGDAEIDNNAYGCNSQVEVEEACEFVSIEEQSTIDILSLFPNPAKQEVNISKDDGREVDQVTLYTLTGQQVLHVRPVNGKVDISHLQPGMYIVEVTIKNTKVRQKLLVQ